MKSKHRTKLPNVFKWSAILIFALIVTGVPASHAGDGPSEQTWNEIRFDLFGEDDIADGSHLMELKTPYRAEDAAIVPFEFTAKPGVRLESVAIVIDENPAPLAATFIFGPAAAEHAFETRFRINSYSHVRAVAKAEDGKLYMVKNFVKASGGCSAPASKDMDQALASIGRMKFRQFSSPAADNVPVQQAASLQMSTGAHTGILQGQVMIRHPNYSGLQMDQVTMLYIPAHFVDEIEIRHGDDLVMRVEGGISISEDPNIRFFYRAGGAQTLSVKAGDTEQQIFQKSWPLEQGS